MHQNDYSTNKKNKKFNKKATQSLLDYDESRRYE